MIQIRVALKKEVLFRTLYTSLSDSWNKHMVLPQTETIILKHHDKLHLVCLQNITVGYIRRFFDGEL